MDTNDVNIAIGNPCKVLLAYLNISGTLSIDDHFIYIDLSVYLLCFDHFKISLLSSIYRLVFLYTTVGSHLTFA